MPTVFVGGLASLTVDPSKIGTRFGMVFSMIAFATLAGPPTAGALIQSDGGSFLKAQLWAGSVTVAGALFIYAAKGSQLILYRRAQRSAEKSSREQRSPDAVPRESV